THADRAAAAEEYGAAKTKQDDGRAQYSTKDELRGDRPRIRRNEWDFEGDRQAPAEKLNQQLQQDRAGGGPENRPGAPEQRHQNHLDVVFDRERVVLVDEDVPLREDPARQARHRGRESKRRDLGGGGVDAEDRGRF